MKGRTRFYEEDTNTAGARTPVTVGKASGSWENKNKLIRSEPSPLHGLKAGWGLYGICQSE